MADKFEGVPTLGWESILRLAGLATVGMLKRDRRRPAPDQKPAAQYWTGHRYDPLYKPDEAVDLPPLSPGRQRLYDANRTCARCGKRAKAPWEKGRDGKRYCHPCQEPAAVDLWHREQAERYKASTLWAREVLADERVLLVASRAYMQWREVRVEDLAGEVLLDAKVRHQFDDRVDPQVLEDVLARVPDSVSPPEILNRLRAVVDGRRLIGWTTARDLSELGRHFAEHIDPWDEVPVITSAPGDLFGKRYDNWVGQVSGSYLHHPRVAQQSAPWEPAELIAEMRSKLAWMAASEVSDG